MDVLMSRVSSLAAVMRYRDVAAAIEWLCASFGFEKQTVKLGEKGAVIYAQLTFGDGMIIIGCVDDPVLNAVMKQPDEIGGAETQSCYIVVDDADAHYAKAKASGAEIVLDIQGDDESGRNYSCRDPEGHLWNFGTYDPWQGQRPRQRSLEPMVAAPPGGRRWGMAGSAVAIALVSMAATVWVSNVHRQPNSPFSAILHQEQPPFEKMAVQGKEYPPQAAELRLAAGLSAREAAERSAQQAREQLKGERNARESAERDAKGVREELDAEKSAREIAQRVADGAQEELNLQLETERGARKNAEHAAAEARAQLNNLLAGERRKNDAAPSLIGEEARKDVIAARIAQEAAEQAVRATREQLDRERSVSELAKREVEMARRQLAEANSAREATERAAEEARSLLDRERGAKNSALKAVMQMRRQLSQYASPAAYSTNGGVGAKSVPTRPKMQRKQKPAENVLDQ